ncbi:MAG: thymidylate synthase [Planctomycetes bacterium]|nr:thymidylate synthase [Planctomycetota bacterium]
MKQYLDLLAYVRQQGKRKPQRAKLSDGRRPEVLSIFGYQFRLDLADGFPMVTTKKLPWGAIVHELLWFLSGSTNVEYLRANKVTIWNEWADANGELGPVYGKQWRRWEGPNGKTVDQIAAIVTGIRKVMADPQASEARRLLLTAWNPGDMPDPKVPTGCHTFAQFNVHDDRLSCQLYQRSADLFLGVPFNIASYALLTHLLAKVVGLQAGDYIHTFGDAHIYENHFDQVDEQLRRETRPLPTLELDDTITSMDGIRFEQMRLKNYNPHPPLRGEVAV